MATFSVRSPTRRVLGISLFLLLVLLQMFTSLVFYAGVFVQPDGGSNSPFGDHYEQSYNDYHRSSPTGFHSLRNSCFQLLFLLCLYVPVVLVPFALLAILLAAYAKDRAALRFSLVCQAASSSLNMTALFLFLLLNVSYLSWKNMTLCFYIYASVPAELAITTLLTAFVSERNPPSDWE